MINVYNRLNLGGGKLFLDIIMLHYRNGLINAAKGGQLNCESLHGSDDRKPQTDAGMESVATDHKNSLCLKGIGKA